MLSIRFLGLDYGRSRVERQNKWALASTERPYKLVFHQSA